MTERTDKIECDEKSIITTTPRTVLEAEQQFRDEAEAEVRAAGEEWRPSLATVEYLETRYDGRILVGYTLS